MIGLEAMHTGDEIERNFNRLNALVLDTGGVAAGVRFGSGTLTFPGGSPNTAVLTVTHGLGRVPVSIQCLPIASASPIAIFSNGTSDETTMGIRGVTFDGSSPAAAASQNFYWLAIG